MLAAPMLPADEQGCAGSGAATGSPFWVTTGYAGGTGQPAVNANPVPGYTAQVGLHYWGTTVTHVS